MSLFIQRWRDVAWMPSPTQKSDVGAQVPLLNAVVARLRTAQLPRRSRGSDCASRAWEWRDNCRCFSPVNFPAIPSFPFRKQGSHPHEISHRNKRGRILWSEKNNECLMFVSTEVERKNPTIAHRPHPNNRGRRVSIAGPPMKSRAA